MIFSGKHQSINAGKCDSLKGEIDGWSICCDFIAFFVLLQCRFIEKVIT